MKPRFSVLLPTKDRLEYLRYAVETVRRQDFEDWELVVSDNCSDADVEGYLRTIDDNRVRYIRAEEPLSVTDNWNRSLEASRGEYVLMLGDDDGLLPGHLRRCDKVLVEHHNPDVLYTGAYLFTYPSVTDESPNGNLRHYGYATFLTDGDPPPGAARTVSSEKAKHLVSLSLEFRMRFGYNMQFTVIRRGFVDSLRSRGPFFQSSFPDFYAMNASFLMANRIVGLSSDLVVIGVTRRSYGYFHAQHREDLGREFLGTASEADVYPALKDILLPGYNINTGWLAAMESLKDAYGDHLPAEINYGRYRWLQALYVHEHYFLRETLPRSVLLDLRARLRPGGLLLSMVASPFLAMAGRIWPTRRATLAAQLGRYLRFGQNLEWDVPRLEGRYQNILEVFADVDPDGYNAIRR